ncbi:MAG: hypothetical protein ACRC9U_02665 [Metamycoplasmataceae bacterium]
MKAIKKILIGLGSLGLISAGVSVIVASNNLIFNIDNNEDNFSNTDSKVNINELDYFYTKKTTLELEKERNIINERLRLIIKEYDLQGWNTYYSKDNKYDSRIWELKKSDYNLDKKIPNNDTYQKQDEQYKYFEDFIFTINPVQIKQGNSYINQKDSFLFRRYQLLSIDRAIEFQKDTDVQEIDFIKWEIAIVLIGVGDLSEIEDIIKKLLIYFGTSKFFKPNLAAADLLLRIKDKDYDNYQKSNIKKWANEIWELEKKLNILKIIEDTFKKNNPSGDIEIPEPYRGIIDVIANFFSDILIGPNRNVNESDFYK